MSTTEQKALALRLADEQETLLLEVANGERKPGKLPLEPFVRGAAELRRLSAENEALRFQIFDHQLVLRGWEVRTEWLRTSLEPWECGDHLADVLRARIDALRAQVEALTRDTDRQASKISELCAELEDREARHRIDRQRLQTIQEHRLKECWYWQGDGQDHLESLVGSLPVVIRADQLRELTRPASFPERDTTKPAEQQGLFRKFVVNRVDGSDAPGGKHHGCEYFVLDMDHDKAAPAALVAYAEAVAETHPQLAADLRARFGEALTRPAVPEGWKLVKSPITEEMHVAACKVLIRASGLDGLPQRMLNALAAAAPQPETEVHEPKCPALAGGDCTCTHSDKHDQAIDRSWARFCAKFGDGPDAPYPGMISAFERYYNQSFADKEWRTESAVWAAAWKAAMLAAPQSHATDGSTCWCNPEIIKEDGGDVIVHDGADNWQQYAKPGETAQACIERHRAEHDSLLRLLAEARANPQPEGKSTATRWPEHLNLAVDQWFAQNTGLGGCSDNDVSQLAAIFYDLTYEGGRESVDDALAVVDSFGPGTEGLNDAYARQVILAAEVKRLRGLYAAGMGDPLVQAAPQPEAQPSDRDAIFKALQETQEALNVSQCPWCGEWGPQYRDSDLPAAYCHHEFTLRPWKAFATGKPEAQPTEAANLPTIKGASLSGGYVIVTPAGWGDDKAPAVRDAILKLFPVDPKFHPKPTEAAQKGGV